MNLQTYEIKYRYPHLRQSFSSFDLKILVFVRCFGIQRHSVTENTVVGTHREDENVNRLEVFLDSLIEIVVDVPVK
jgi:hypothetical protein